MLAKKPSQKSKTRLGNKGNKVPKKGIPLAKIAPPPPAPIPTSVIAPKRKDVLEAIIKGKEKDIQEIKHSELDYSFLAKIVGRGEETFVKRLKRFYRCGRPAFIAEIKPASPSAGPLWQEHIGIEGYVKALEKGGAACLSVLGEELFFKGGVHYIEQARRFTNLPILWKDFFVDPLQVDEAAISGCDAILVIMHIVDNTTAKALLERAWYMGLDVLLECHRLEDILRLEALGSSLKSHVALAINNRNLETFQCSLDVAAKMKHALPSHHVQVAASGINAPQDVRALIAMDFYVFLVGEHLMRAKDPEKALRTLITQSSHAR